MPENPLQCRLCGSSQESDACYCDQCGELLKLDSTRDTFVHPKGFNSSNTRIVVSVGLVIAVALSVGALIGRRPAVHHETVHETDSLEREANLSSLRDLQGSDSARAIQAAHYFETKLLTQKPVSGDEAAKEKFRHLVERYGKSLTSSDPGTRRAAVSVLTMILEPHNQFRNKEVLGPLIEGLGSSDSLLRYLSVTQLRLYWLRTSADQIARQVIHQLTIGLPKTTEISPNASQETLRLYQAADRLGFNYPFFYSLPVLREIVHNRIEKDSRPIAVVIMMRGDLKTRRGLLPFSVDPLLTDLANHGYGLQLFEASQDLDIASAIEAATVIKKASFLLLVGHADQMAQSYGSDDQHPLNRESVKRLKPRELWRHFDQGSQAFILGCSSGRGGADVENVANFVRKLFPKSIMTSIFAPVDNLQVPDHLLFNEKGWLENRLPGKYMPKLYEA